MKYLSLSFFMLLLVILFIFVIPQNNVATNNTKTYCDSISSLNFEYENRINRYEITLEILKQENPSLAREFEKIMTTQTE